MIVRSAGSCEQCGSNYRLECAHILGRRAEETRTLLANALCLCARCHRHFTEHPNDWRTFVGEPRWLALTHHEAPDPFRFDWDRELLRLCVIAVERDALDEAEARHRNILPWYRKARDATYSPDIFCPVRDALEALPPKIGEGQDPPGGLATSF